MIALLLAFCCVLRVNGAYDSDFIIPPEHACTWPIFERFHFKRWIALTASERFPKVNSNSTVGGKLNATLPDKVPKLLLVMLDFFEKAPTAMTSIVTRAHHMLHVIGYIAHMFERTHRYDDQLVNAMLDATENGTIIGVNIFRLGHNFISKLPARRFRMRSLQCLESVMFNNDARVCATLFETLAWLTSLAQIYKGNTYLSDAIDKEYGLVLTYLSESHKDPGVYYVHQQLQTCQSYWLRERMDSIPEE